jgi:hypothetical protein
VVRKNVNTVLKNGTFHRDRCATRHLNDQMYCKLSNSVDLSVLAFQSQGGSAQTWKAGKCHPGCLEMS